ncbi:MAG: DNA-binding transcriptional LysR family regulator [Paracoccaceae bacterium]|jgi:LysR family glycine cleavage system transcriptional activator
MIRLPPLRMLVTFEAVARLGTMREAASALNVTQPAVTQALRALEDHIGVTLMDRSRKPARLTAQGHFLARATCEGLEMIAATIEELRSEADAQNQSLTVSCTIGMATYWLMPRLPDFYNKHPDIMVNVQTTPTDTPSISPGVDLALRYGIGGWGDGETVKLFDEIVCPVGRPAVIDRLLKEGRGLEGAPLIHVRAPETHHWAGWSDYLKRTGLRRPTSSGPIFNNYIQAVQAALDGRGLVLGWRSITEALVDEGSLVRWPDGAVNFGTAYSATTSPASASKASTKAFLTWLSCGHDM